MERVIECRHIRVMKRQKAKFEALIQWQQGGCSNQGHIGSSQMNGEMEDTRTEVNKKWVRNLSSTPLTEAIGQGAKVFHQAQITTSQ